jgi:hypothetical protein
MLSINESTTAYLTVSFYDKNGALAVPESASYTITCITTGTTVKTTTAMSAASSVELTLSTTDNALINRNNDLEERAVNVTALYSSGTEKVTDQYRYNVKKLNTFT